MNVIDARTGERTWISSMVAIWVIVAGLHGPTFSADLDAGQVADQVSVDSYRAYLENDLYAHAGDERAYGPKHDLAQKRIRELFESFGLTTSLDPFVYNGATYYNVVAVHPGVTRPREIYIVGAHYDSVAGAPGAVDNASGVAGVLEAARAMSQYLFESTVVFIAFDREEQRWKGSEAYARDHAQEDIRGMIALDMIAYQPYQPAQPEYATVVLYYHTQRTEIVDDLTATLKSSGGLNSVVRPSPFLHGFLGLSDYVPFADLGFPAVLLNASAWETHPFYHKPADSLDKLTDADYRYAAQITKGTVGYLATHAGIEPVRALPDFNHDGKIDIEDLTTLIEHWGRNDPNFDIAPPPLGDGIVDQQDLEGLMHYWDQEIPDPTLAAYWKLDETEGALAADSVGGADGAVVGDALWQPAAGVIDGALAFDGQNDYVKAEYVPSLPMEPFSVVVWVKGGAPGQVILSQEKGTNWLLVGPDGGLKTDLKSGGRGKALASPVLITDDTWHRVGFAWDGSNRILYVDDVEAARDTQSNLAGSEAGLHIGTGATLAAGSFWSGLIDDVRIYNRAVTP
jgi:hypothetical protein